MATRRPRPPAVGTTTLVDLKAELFKKQEEARRLRRTTLQVEDSGEGGVERSRAVSDKTASIWLKPKTKQRAELTDEGGHVVPQESSEEEQLLAKSRLALEAKARAYEEMSKGRGLPDEELNRHGDLCLVDFDRKIYEQTPTSSTDDRSSTASQVAKGDEWVEYVDRLGRTRKCLKTDLPELTHLDKEEEEGLGEGQEEGLGEGQEEGVGEGLRERLKEGLGERLSTTVEESRPAEEHYQTVLNQEVRTHGVGYYQFSQDQEQRQEQLAALGRLREQTVHQRSRSEGVKAKRKAMMAARLKKVRQHKLGQIVDTSVEEEEGGGVGEGQEERQAKEYVEKKEEGVSPETGKRYIRPWDRGKVVGPERKRVEEERERSHEFAPPTSYFVKPKYTPKFFTSQEHLPSPTPQDGAGAVRPPFPPPSASGGLSAVNSLIADARAQRGH